MSELSALYEKDFSAWAKRNAELLKAGRYTELDTMHLLEELTDMGTSERNELESRLTILLAHLLKWQYQYNRLSDQWKEFDGRSWRYTILEQRNRIRKRLRASPGLQSRLDELLGEAYQDAVELAAKESGLALKAFPEKCPYAWERIVDDDYFPGRE
jgi:hypothetical protein